MNKILLATNNQDKVKEIKELFSDLEIEVLTLQDIKLDIDVEEDKETLEGNAIKKAETIFNVTGIPCSADDTGLFVEELNGEPGVYSSRYAGENVSYKDNRIKLIQRLKEKNLQSSNAYFKTVVCYYYAKDKYELFSGICEGDVITEERGDKGFGYDAIFVPICYEKTYAEMTIEEKNEFSHRAKAFQRFKEYLKKLDQKLK